VKVGVGVFPFIAEPKDVHATFQEGHGHAALRGQVTAVPPGVTRIQYHGDLNPAACSVDHGLHKMRVLQLVEVHTQGIGGTVHPSEQIEETRFRADQRHDLAAGAHGCVVAEGASTQPTPSVMPIFHTVGVGCVAASVATEVDEVFQARKRLGQRGS